MTVDELMDKIEAETVIETSPIYGFKLYDDIYTEIDTLPAIGITEVRANTLNSNSCVVVKNMSVIITVYMLKQEGVRRTKNVEHIIEAFDRIMEIAKGRSTEDGVDFVDTIFNGSEEGLVGVYVVTI